MCVQIFHMVNIDVPAGDDAPPLNTQLHCCYHVTPSGLPSLFPTLIETKLNTVIVTY